MVAQTDVVAKKRAGTFENDPYHIQLLHLSGSVCVTIGSDGSVEEVRIMFSRSKAVSFLDRRLRRHRSSCPPRVLSQALTLQP